MQIVGATALVGLWALERAWIFFLDHSIFIDDTNTFQLPDETNTFQLKLYI